MAPTAFVLTPSGRAAVASILVHGDGASDCVDRFFRASNGRPLAAQQLDAIHFGRWGHAAGEELVVCLKARDQIEIHCHGGQAAVAAIIGDLVAAGCRQADWKAALQAHYRAPFAAEAAALLTKAATRRTAAILLDQLQGALSRAVAEIRGAVLAGQPSQACSGIDRLLTRADVGRHLVEPWKVVLAGTPNVGKSSLANALLGYRRAIVFDTPGTTRDVVTADAVFDGWPVELADTAGLRSTDEPLEAAGVKLTSEKLAEADLVLLVFDVAAPWTSADDALCAAWPGAIVVHNKCDLVPHSSVRRPGLSTSATQRRGLDELERAIVARLVPDAPAAGEAVPFCQDQVAFLREAAKRLSERNTAVAIELLGRFECQQ